MRKKLKIWKITKKFAPILSLAPIVLALSCGEENKEQDLQTIRAKLIAATTTTLDGEGFKNLRFNEKIELGNGSLIGVNVPYDQNKISITFTKQENFKIKYLVIDKSFASNNFEVLEVTFVSSSQDEKALSDTKNFLGGITESILSEDNFKKAKFNNENFVNTRLRLGLSHFYTGTGVILASKTEGENDVNYEISYPLAQGRILATFENFERFTPPTLEIASLEQKLQSIKTTTLPSTNFYSIVIDEIDYLSPNISSVLGVELGSIILPEGVTSLRVTKSRNDDRLFYRVYQNDIKVEFGVEFNNSIYDVSILTEVKSRLELVNSSDFTQEGFSSVIIATPDDKTWSREEVYQKLALRGINILDIPQTLMFKVSKGLNETIVHYKLAIGRWHNLPDFEVEIVNFYNYDLSQLSELVSKLKTSALSETTFNALEQPTIVISNEIGVNFGINLLPVIVKLPSKLTLHVEKVKNTKVIKYTFLEKSLGVPIAQSINVTIEYFNIFNVDQFLEIKGNQEYTIGASIFNEIKTLTDVTLRDEKIKKITNVFRDQVLNGLKIKHVKLETSLDRWNVNTGNYEFRFVAWNETTYRNVKVKAEQIFSEFFDKIDILDSGGQPFIPTSFGWFFKRKNTDTYFVTNDKAKNEIRFFKLNSEGKFEQVDLVIDLPSIPSLEGGFMYEDSRSNWYLYMGDGIVGNNLFVFDTVTNKFKTFANIRIMGKNNFMFEDANAVLFITSSNGVYRYDQIDRAFKLLSGSPIASNDTEKGFFFVDSAKNLYLGTFNQGIWKWNFAIGAFERTISSINNVKNGGMFEAKDGTIYIMTSGSTQGTLTGGIWAYNRFTNSLRLIHNSPSMYWGGMFQDEFGKIYVFSRNLGVYFMTKDEAFVPIKNAPIYGNSTTSIADSITYTPLIQDGNHIFLNNYETNATTLAPTKNTGIFALILRSA